MNVVLGEIHNLLLLSFSCLKNLLTKKGLYQAFISVHHGFEIGLGISPTTAAAINIPSSSSSGRTNFKAMMTNLKSMTDQYKP